MSVSDESAGSIVGSETSTPGFADETGSVADVNPKLDKPIESRAFLLGVIGISLLIAGGIVGQLFGLKSIQGYSELRSRLVGFEAEYERLSREINQHRAALADLRQKKSQAEYDEQRAQIRLAKVAADEEMLREAVIQAQKERDDAEEQRAEASSETREAEEQKQSAEEAMANLVARITTLRDEYGALQGERDSVQHIVQGLSENRARVDAALTSATVSLAELTKEAGQKREDLAVLNSKLAAAEEELTWLQGRNDKLADVNGDIDALERERADLIKSTAEQSRLRESAEEERAKVERKLANAEALLEITNSSLSRGEDQQTALQESTDALVLQESSLKDRVNGVKAELRALQDESASLKQQVEEARDRLASLAGQIQGQRAVLKDKQAEVSILEDKQRDLAVVGSRLTSAQDCLAETEGLVAKEKGELDRLQTLVRDLRDEEWGRLTTLSKLIHSERMIRDAVGSDVSTNGAHAIKKENE